MSEMIEDFALLKQFKQMRRATFGKPCPVCKELLPRAHPKILEPGQLCRAHKPHYRDPRPEPTIAEIDAMIGANE